MRLNHRSVIEEMRRGIQSHFAESSNRVFTIPVKHPILRILEQFGFFNDATTKNKLLLHKYNVYSSYLFENFTKLEEPLPDVIKFNNKNKTLNNA